MKPSISPAIHRFLSAVALAAAALLAGCASVPPSHVQQAPAVAIPTQWNSVAAQGDGIVTEHWWRDFDDIVLNTLVETALEANRGLKIATARMAQARALVDGAQAARMPRVDAGASAQRGREDAVSPRVERSSLGLRAAWEIDLFGRGALAVAAAEAHSDGATRALQAARIALVADVANAYFELRTLDQRLALKRDAIAIAEQQVATSSRKFQAGQATALDRERWQAELAQERASLAQIEGERGIRHQQLALLLGQSQVPELAGGTAASVPTAPAALLPAALLERRPDVQLQARALDAALARAGLARREIYPSLQIAWSGARERSALIGSSAAPRLVLGYGVSLSLPIIDGGRIRANVAVHDAQAQQAMAEYEKAMLVALTDVETSFVQWSAAGTALHEWQQAEAAGATAARNASRLYEAGMVDVTAVLSARQSHLEARDALAQAVGARWKAAVGLRRVFAGDLRSAESDGPPARVARNDS